MRSKVDTSHTGTRRRWIRYLGGLYLGLLVLSHLVRLFQSPPPLRSDQQAAFVRVIDGDRIGAEQVLMPYTDLQPSGVEDPPTLILLHGSPMASMSMMRLAPLLADSFRVVVPDLPGMGRSTLDVPDYSVKAHGRYLIQLMDSLAINQAHMIAYSLAGGVVLEAYDYAPERIRSTVMLSAVGVQELELLGDYLLNRAVHGMQLGFLWLLQEGFPHFGYMDDALLNVSYARNFYDTDQRPLRGILERYTEPMLILHGRSDMQVPFEAALEHARIVPQSDTVWFNGGHILLFNPDERMISTIVDFVKAAENGTAPVRATADPDRTAAAQAPFDWDQVPKATGLTLIVFMLLIMIATLVSEDLTCIGAGLLVAQGTIDFWPATIACFLGILGGDILLFLAGRMGQVFLHRAPFRWFIKDEALEQGSRWLHRRGPSVVIASRFVPGSRLPTYVSAGLLGMNFWRFMFYFVIASIVWTPLLVGLSVVVGREMIAYLAVYQSYAIWIVLGTILVIWLGVRLVVPLFNFRGRRLLLSAWRRKVRWEFWPPWFFYPPLIFYIIGLMIRYRSVTLFTAANPAIEGGGFVGESKSGILNGLAGAGSVIASFAVLEPGHPISDRMQRVRAFMERHGLQYPIVLKPDVGERGSKVAVVRSDEEVRVYLEQYDERIIVQEYAPGAEFGVFYYRYPDQPHGRIFSITDKQFPAVTGDGRSTLEELILSDDRAVCMARFFLDRHCARLHDVPGHGERVRLVELGTHARGALFLDGWRVYTPEMETAIDRLSRHFEGFYFGRYDIRTPSVEDFMQGRNFKVVELNGVTSEATHIYDPRNSIFEAYRVLRKQWKTAFEIGAANRDRGVRPAGPRELIGNLIRYKVTNDYIPGTGT